MTDKTYEKSIDALIPRAAAAADRHMAKKHARRDERSAMWNAVFHGSMNRLSREAGFTPDGFRGVNEWKQAQISTR